ncbi:MAG: signal peptidase I [Planctomycetota bacterium]
MKDIVEALKSISKEIGSIVFVWVISLIFTNYSCEVVRTSQMEPRLKTDSIKILKNVYSKNDIERGDIVAYYRYDSDINENLRWGRVIAIENDRLTIKDNKIYINDTQLAESYLSEESKKLPSISDLVIPASCVFVLNDARNDEFYYDSRDFGPIYLYQIKGKIGK